MCKTVWIVRYLKKKKNIGCKETKNADDVLHPYTHTNSTFDYKSLV